MIKGDTIAENIGLSNVWAREALQLYLAENIALNNLWAIKVLSKAAAGFLLMWMK